MLDTQQARQQQNEQQEHGCHACRERNRHILRHCLSEQANAEYNCNLYHQFYFHNPSSVIGKSKG